MLWVLSLQILVGKKIIKENQIDEICFAGITVCLPSPAFCMKEVAKHISDRDNAVRNAALNCVVQAYYIVGDKVFKLVGQVRLEQN